MIDGQDVHTKGVFTLGQFVSSWLVSDGEADKVVWSVTCAKWETLCLLASVIVLNLRDWAAHQDKTSAECAQYLKHTVACSRRAIVDLKAWWDVGNRSSWDTDSDNAPEEANFHFFETARALSEMLFELTCLAKASTHAEICAHGYNCVLLSVINKAEQLSQYEHVPACLAGFVEQVCVAVSIAVGQTIWKSANALRVLEPPRTVRWKDVHSLYKRSRDSLKYAKCFEMDLMAKTDIHLEEFERTLECIRRISAGTLTEDPATSKPLTAVPTPRSLEYAFPFCEHISI
jgi:hypothetical protein